MNQFIAGLGQFAAEEDGVTMVEYGLIAGLIAVVCIAAITTMGNQLNRLFNYIGTKLTGVTTP